jgi:hypothetical protein
MPSARRWWQTTRTVRQGYLLAGLFLLIGAAELAASAGSGGAVSWAQLAVGLLASLTGVAYFTTALALRRHQRRSPS